MEKESQLKELLLKGLAGDAKAYQTFLKELSMYLRRFIRKRLSYLPDEVEDLVQESLLAIHNQRHTYNPGLPGCVWPDFPQAYSQAARAPWFIACTVQKWIYLSLASGIHWESSRRQ